MNTIHPTAIIDPKCELGENITIGPYSVIGPKVRIGDGSLIYNHVTIAGPTTVGKNASIFSFAVVGTDSQDKKFDRSKGEGTLEIGDDCTIREHCSLNRGSYGEAVTKVGKGCHILACSHVAHDCTVGDYATFSNYTALAGHVTIGRHVTTGGYVAFHQFVEVGDYCMVSSRSTVKADIPPYLLLHGAENARAVTINKVGLERTGFTAEDIRVIEKAFRIYFKNPNLLRKDALQKIRAEYGDSGLIQPFIEFIENHDSICPSD